MAAKVRIQRGGWCRVVLDDSETELKVRFAESGTGRLAVAEVTVGRLGGVTADVLRAIPMGRLEAFANSPAEAERLLAAIVERSTMSDDERNALDSSERAEANLRAEWGTPVEVEAPMVDLAGRRPGKLQLRVPPGQPKPDDFYRRVAHVYSHLAAGPSAQRPAVALAEANGVPTSTVHAWVKEARRRGLLAPGERATRRNTR